MRGMKTLALLAVIALVALSGCSLSTPADRNQEVVDRLDRIIKLLEEEQSPRCDGSGIGGGVCGP